MLRLYLETLTANSQYLILKTIATAVFFFCKSVFKEIIFRDPSGVLLLTV